MPHAWPPCIPIHQGFCFITPDDGGDDVFCHKTELVGVTDLEENEPVTFVLGANEGRPCAKQVETQRNEGNVVRQGKPAGGAELQAETPEQTELIDKWIAARNDRDYEETKKIQRELRVKHGLDPTTFVTRTRGTDALSKTKLLDWKSHPIQR